MTYPDWRSPVEKLQAATGAATEDQLQVAVVLGCPHSNEPRGVLTAVIEAWLSPVLYGKDPLPATEKQLAFLEELGHAPTDAQMYRPVASAWIDHHLSVRTAAALEDLELKTGDRVHRKRILIDPSTDEVVDLGGLETVSSIGSNGLVYFKGGNGKCGWPTSLRSMK